MPTRPSLLYVTDPTYPAQGRRYSDEDILLSSRLRADFDIALCHPLDAASLMDRFDAVVVRNSGPVLHYQKQYERFRDRARAHGIRVYNPLTGHADMAGKQYLLDLTRAGQPVIPTIDSPQDLDRLPPAAEYAVKPKAGADSVGLSFVPREELSCLTPGPLPHEAVLIQPRIDFRYEVSFIYVDNTFQYAVHAPDPGRRWALEPYAATDADLAFARRFIDWNGLDHGIQRVDACRTQDGDLLLVELEDLNPYLSLDRLDEPTLDAFVTALKTSLHNFLAVDFQADEPGPPDPDHRRRAQA